MNDNKRTTTVGDLMSIDPITLSCNAPVMDAARRMRVDNVGAVLVRDGSKLCGIVTDRDLAVRVMATGRAADSTRLGEVCSGELTTLSPKDDIEHAIELMRKKGIRRIPVREGTTPVGMLSLGDLALSRDPNSVLGGISAAAPNL